MTEKRYMIEDIGNMFRVLKDNEPLTTKFENCDKQDVNNLIAELNELAEENQQLQQKLNYAEKVNTRLIDENHRLRLTIIHSSDLNFDINWLKENLKDWNNYE